MSEIKIEVGIPMPQRRYGDGAHELVKAMNIGDSFLITNKPQPNVCSQFGAIARRIGVKLRTAKVEGGVRVWRVE